MSTLNIHRRAFRVLAVLGLLAIGAGQALAATSADCNVATSQGVDGPIDWGAYCWIDFTGYNASLATGGGQDFIVTLPGGATLTFTLTVDNDELVPDSVPSWSGAAFGNSAFLGILGKPVLYQYVQGANTTITLSSLVLSANGSPNLPFVFIAADGESTNTNESLVFTTTGDPWQLVASPGQSNPNRTMPTLNGVGTTTVTETGNSAGATGSYVFSTDNSPGTVVAALDGSGLQGALFGLKFHSIDLALTKSYAGDDFIGGTGSFQLDATNTVTSNQNPPISPQPVRLQDTLPAGITYTGFSGTGWSCSASGQTVTCDLPNVNLNTPPNTTVHLPLLTLNVSIDNNAPASVTNTAIVWDNTTGYVFDTNQPNNTASKTIAIKRPDLSTSTKTVVDQNGGDANPGDVLEYTITLIETGGAAASNVHVTDDMPLHVGNLAVTNDAGGTDNSTTNGGANGTGYLDISGIGVPANSSKTIVFEVTIAGAAQPGDTVDNTATIDNPSGPDAAPSAPTITVSQSQIPASGNKILYVYDNQSLTRTPQTGSGSYVLIGNGNSKDWTLTPVLAKPLTIEANSTISVTLLVQCDGQYGWGGCRQFWQGLTFTASLYAKNGASLTQIGSTSSDASFNYTSYTAVTANIPVGASAVTVPAGDQLVLRIANTAGANNDLRVEQYSGGNRSTATLSVSTAINVDSVDTYTNASCSSVVNQVFVTADTVYICAVVSDPFGAYDIDPATGGTTPTITITDSNATQQVNAANMVHVASADTTSTKAFSYTYTVPTSPPAILALGGWTASVTAWEGTEHTISHTANGVFVVGAPNLVILKSVSVVSGVVPGATKPKALPGARIRYSIMITNQGKGAVDNNQLVITDAIPANTTFVNSSIGSSQSNSGLSTLTASDILFSADNGNSWTQAPGATVTDIKAVPQGSMDGKIGPTAPTYTITFDVVIQ